MSDLLVSDASLHVPIREKGDLIAYFEAGAKPVAEWRVGTEWEFIGVDRSSGSAARYSGQRGIEEVLRRLASHHSWTPREEAGHVVAVKGPKATIALEPGGQVELAGQPCDTLHCASDELEEHIAPLVEHGRELDIAFLGVGTQPLSALDEIEWVPKHRYRIMAGYMPKVGKLGLSMMKQTASVQANFDFSDERDAMDKLRVATALAPVIAAMFANSAILGGRNSGYATFRHHVWSDTDRSRCGMLDFLFSPAAGFEDYTDWALDVPMYFVQRNDRLIDLTGTTFREFWKYGAEGETALMADWQLHLTTLFPETRLKQYIEVRGADCQPGDRLMAVPALFKGILYDADCRLGAWDLVQAWSWNERMDAMHETDRLGMAAKVRGIRVLELAQELLEIATEGLRRQNAMNDAGENETKYLYGLEQLLSRGESAGETAARLFESKWREDVRYLVAETELQG